MSGFIVPGTGIEPAHPCERQILSLLRLPIPPPGHFESGCNIKPFPPFAHGYDLNIFFCNNTLSPAAILHWS
jgi:hypothetical protein